MLTRLRVRNFKCFGDIDVPLDTPVVFVGPNNSGKTTALQALVLWEVGLRFWNSRRGGRASPEKRPGVTINRRDLTQIPVPVAKLLWRSTDVRRVTRSNGRQSTRNIRIDVIVDGITKNREWSCGLEFDYSNEESLVCRPLRLAGHAEDPVHTTKFSEVPPEALNVRLALLPPMSGLMATEPKWEIGRINVLVGEGQTAQVIRNLCHYVYELDGDHKEWTELQRQIKGLFGATLFPPTYLAERGEIQMQYRDHTGATLDLSSAGRGLLQTLLLFAHMYTNPGSVLLIDEPDAHLEILRQRQTFNLIVDLAAKRGSQIIVATHSEVVMNEAAGHGTVVAFVGAPHKLNDRGSQAAKALTDIGWDQYYQAQQTGWVLYLEGPTDLAILQSLAEVAGHRAAALLERPFVHYVATNLPAKAREHFYAIREAKADLLGLAVFDRIEKDLRAEGRLTETMWTRRELENYLCSEAVLLEWARAGQGDDLFGRADAAEREQAMRDAIVTVTKALQDLGRPSPWSPDVKASDDVLDPIFRRFSRTLGQRLALRKSDYHLLARHVRAEDVDADVIRVLDQVVAVAAGARPAA
jgi:hypothetical protein